MDEVPYALHVVSVRLELPKRAVLPVHAAPCSCCGSENIVFIREMKRSCYCSVGSQKELKLQESQKSQNGSVARDIRIFVGQWSRVFVVVVGSYTKNVVVLICLPPFTCVPANPPF